MKTKTTNLGLPYRIRLRFLPTGKLFVVSFICSMLVSFFSPSVFGQCDPPDLPGVPDGIIVEESYVRTKTITALFPSNKMVEDYSDLDHALTQESRLIEKFHHGLNSNNEPIIIREVLNPSEYFPNSVYPYTHAIVNNENGSIYNGNLRLSSFHVPIPPLEEMDPEDEQAIISLETNLNINWLENGIATFSTGDLIVTIDTSNNSRISTRLNGYGEIDMVHFTQFDPVNRSRTIPIYEVRLEKTSFTDTDGDCLYELTEEIYSSYCSNEDINDTENQIEARFDNKKLRPDVNIVVYPNPALDQVRVDLSQDKLITGEIESVEVLNSGGQLVDVVSTDTPTGILLNVQDYRTGLYIIRVKTEGKFYISKFLKL